MPKRKAFCIESELMQRELGSKFQSNQEEQIIRSLYSGIGPELSWHPDSFGGIFNLEFSPNGKILAAACERRMIVGFDPSTHMETFRIDSAHMDCVNGIKFLNDRQFASCSDDETIALWDLRNLSQEFRSLHGHTNWVKSLDYIPDENVLISSGFDDNVFAWDLSEPLQEELVVRVNKLMRSKLTPDCKRMLICSNWGFIAVIQNFNWRKFLEDYRNFNPTDGRHFDENKRNKIEYISDFPHRVQQLHSMQTLGNGNFAVSRCISEKNTAEYTCVHNIEPKTGLDHLQQVKHIYHLGEDDLRETGDISRGVNQIIEMGSRTQLVALPGSFYGRTKEQTLTMKSKHAKVPLKAISIDISARKLTKSLHRRYMKPKRLIQGPDRNFRSHESYVISGDESSIIAGTEQYDFVQARPIVDAQHHTLYHAQSRLTHFIQESQKGSGFIKEMSVSSDGKVICSPHGNSIRLLAFDESCSEPTYEVGASPRMFHTISTISCHSNNVLSSAFAPHGCQIVTGSYDGEIVWHYASL